MAIHFEPGRWQRVQHSYNAFWNRKSDRLVYGVALREHPQDFSGDIPLLSQANCNDFSVTPGQIADRALAHLSQYEFYGDAYPLFNMDCYGPGVVAAFLGAQLDNSTGNVWFHPAETREIGDLQLRYDPENPWLQRVREVCAAMTDRFEGRALVGLPDLGGVLDILSTFLPGEQLLYDLVDEPETVRRLCAEVTALWHRYCDEFLGICALPGGGNSNWSTLYSQSPSYIVQCDFSYMIGPDMFGEFVLPTIRQHCEKLEHVIYHLDGVGELPHLPQLLGLEKLDAVQWIPGAGNPQPDHPDYLEIYRRILAAGKQVQVQYCSADVLLNVVQAVGGAGLNHPITWHEAGEKAAMLAALQALGVEV